MFLFAALPAHAALCQQTNRAARSTGGKEGPRLLQEAVQGARRVATTRSSRRTCRQRPTASSRRRRWTSSTRPSRSSAARSADLPGHGRRRCARLRRRLSPARPPSTALPTVRSKHEATDALIETVYGLQRRASLRRANNGASARRRDCPGTCVLASVRTCAAARTTARLSTPTARAGACVLSDEQRDCTCRSPRRSASWPSKRQSDPSEVQEEGRQGQAAADHRLRRHHARTSSTRNSTKALDQISRPARDGAPPTLASAAPATSSDRPDRRRGVRHLHRRPRRPTTSSSCSTAAARAAAPPRSKQITNAADCVGGRMSRCRVNDYLLAQRPRSRRRPGHAAQPLRHRPVRRPDHRRRHRAHQRPGPRQLRGVGALAQHREHRPLHLARPSSTTAATAARRSSAPPASTTCSTSSIRARPSPASASRCPPSPTTPTCRSPSPPTTSSSRAPTTCASRPPCRTPAPPRSTSSSASTSTAPASSKMFQTGYGFGEPLVAPRCPVTADQPLQLHRLHAASATPTASRTATSNRRRARARSRPPACTCRSSTSRSLLALIGARRPAVHACSRSAIPATASR